MGDYESLAAAAADPQVVDVEFSADIESASTVAFGGRSVSIDGKGHKLTFSNTGQNLVLTGGGSVNGLTVENVADTQTWNSTYCLQCYTGTYSVSGFTGTGGNAALLVNSSTMTLGSDIDVSGNSFGGIEVSKSSGEGMQSSSLTVSEKIVNTTEEYGKPTIWVDGADGGTVDGWEAVGMTSSDTVKEDQVQYYNDSANATAPEGDGEGE